MMAQSLTSTYWVVAAFNFFYALVQRLIIWLFKPPPPPSPRLPMDAILDGRIAVVGAGLTGMTCAAHAIAHGFDVVIYEQTCTIGGIWANVDKTSGLRLPSFFYRFHPGVLWSCIFPKRNEILRVTRGLWEEYQLEFRTRFNTHATSIERVKDTGLPFQQRTGPKKAPSKWIINDGVDGEFDAVVVAVGTCGAPKRIVIPGLPQAEQNGIPWEGGRNMEPEGSKPGEVFKGKVVHWSELWKWKTQRIKGKTILVIGNDANGVGAVETALARGAKHCIMFAHDDKWIIRQNPLINTLIALQPFAPHCKLFSIMLEKIVKMLNYCGAPQLVPEHLRIFEDTPVIHGEFANWVRQGRCEYVQGDIVSLTREGLRVKVRNGEMREYEGDVLVYATGFSEPETDFLKGGLFPEGYEYPNLYLGSFSTEDWSVLSINPGTAGHWRTGIYMRILLTFLKYRRARPTPKDMKAWVDNVRYYHRHITPRLRELSFWSYVELVIWLSCFFVSHVSSLKLNWGFFIMQGWGTL